jgi:ZIP family zinc transporter
MNEISTIGTAILLSLVAGMGTGLGGLIAVIRKPGKRSFGFLMGITAGVMITLSFLELVNEAWMMKGFWTATIGFAAGAVFMFMIDFFIPHIRFGESEFHTQESNPGQESLFHPHQSLSNPHFHPHFMRHRHGRRRHQNRIVDPHLLKTGILLAIGITIHNIPEGIAVGAGYMHTPKFGIFIAFAIMLHNIPEGIATALPLCKSGVCRWDSFRVSFLSGLAEPIGALVAALFLNVFQNLVPGALAFAGGVMMFITLDELIPTAREYGHQHFTAIGIILGAIFVFLLSGLMGV